MKVIDVVENEDGSADVQFDLTDEEKVRCIEEGLSFLLLKTVLEGTTDDIFRWANRGKEDS